MTLTPSQQATLDQGAAHIRTMLERQSLDPADPTVVLTVAVVCTTLALLGERLLAERADVDRVLTAFGIAVASWTTLIAQTPGADAGDHTSADPAPSQETP